MDDFLKRKEIASKSFDEGVAKGYAYLFIVYFQDALDGEDEIIPCFVPDKKDFKKNFNWYEDDYSFISEIYDLSKDKDEQINQEHCWSAPSALELSKVDFKVVKENAIKEITKFIYQFGLISCGVFCVLLVLFLIFFAWKYLIVLLLLFVVFCIYKDAKNNWSIFRNLF